MLPTKFAEMRFEPGNGIIRKQMARDAIHNAVKNAIVKDGWTITDDPLRIEYGDVTTYVDLAAERVVAAERNGEKIAIEIKSFLGISLISEFEKALGQYQIYRLLLKQVEPERKIYLAVSDIIYKRLFSKSAVELVVEDAKMLLIIVDLEAEVITEWIKN